MRVAIPLIPWAVVVGLEPRRRQPLRWRFRLRSLLILVVIAALLLGGWTARQRHLVRKERERLWKELERGHRETADRFARQETSHLLSADEGKTSRVVAGIGGKGWYVIRVGPVEHKRIAVYYGRKKRTYEQASARPWLPVESDTDLEDEYIRIADEQGAAPTAEPPPWLTVPGAATGLSGSAVRSGQ
jgi:hypothetical protein